WPWPTLNSRITGEAFTTQRLCIAEFSPQLIGCILERTHLESCESIKKIVPADSRQLRSFRLGNQSDLVPLHRRGKPKLSREQLRRASKNRERIFGKFDRDLYRHLLCSSRCLTRRRSSNGCIAPPRFNLPSIRLNQKA